MRGVLLLSFLLLSSTALADQAYIQANAWAVNRLPQMPGQAPHARCMMQTSFSGTASLQLVTENQKLRGVIVILTEPVFKEEGRDISVTLTVDKKAFEFPAKTLSKYAVAIDISDAYEADFRQRLAASKVVALKSGFNNYTFAVQGLAPPLSEAVNCAPPSPPPVVAAPAPTPAPVPAVVTAEQKVIIGGASKAAADTRGHIVKSAGKDMPLGDAAPLILPPGHKVVFAQGASPGERISWNAGQDWMETLVVALDDANLQVAATGTTVTILPKLKPITMPVVADSGRASVIVKEPGVLAAKTDPSKPPSPGMKDEANLLLQDLRLDEDMLKAIADADVEAPSPKMQPIISEEDTKETVLKKDGAKDDEDIAMPPLPDAPKTVMAAPEQATQVFAAQKGETVKEVLARWSQDSATPIDFNLKRDYFLSQDVRVQGDIELAVEKLFGQFADLPEKPRLTAGVDATTTNTTTSTETATVETAPAPVKDMMHESIATRLGLVSGWSAVKGTSLRGALSNWARDAQMQLVWQSSDDLIVRETVSGTKRFEDALNSLLAQYDDAPQKPLLQVNRDPHTSLLALIVDVQSAAPVKKPDSKPAAKKKKPASNP